MDENSDMLSAEKNAVRSYWDAAPCGTPDVRDSSDEDRLRELERIRYQREPFLERFARFEAMRDKRILEIGVGAGTDHLRFARAGAICTGVDISPVSLELARSRLRREGLTSDLQVADAEALPFPDGSFDAVYSWGVLHHTPDSGAAVQEALRVLRPGGTFCIMLYNRHSAVAAQAWLLFAALRGRPLRSIAAVLAEHMESPGTRAFTTREVELLFREAAHIEVTTVVTAYDMRLGRRRFLPSWTWRMLPQRFGWYHIATGTVAGRSKSGGR
jgi:ubiquinone/menaquinone biosynthesis C-methylase UbiE